MTNDAQVRDRFLFVCSLDSDYNSKLNDFKFDKMGYFLMDV